VFRKLEQHNLIRFYDRCDDNHKIIISVTELMRSLIFENNYKINLFNTCVQVARKILGPNSESILKEAFFNVYNK